MEREKKWGWVGGVEINSFSKKHDLFDYCDHETKLLYCAVFCLIVNRQTHQRERNTNSSQ
jgi:hypothetical protein